MTFVREHYIKTVQLKQILRQKYQVSYSVFIFSENVSNEGTFPGASLRFRSFVHHSIGDLK